MRDIVALVFTGTHGTVSNILGAGLTTPGVFLGLPVGAGQTGASAVASVDDARGA